MIDFEKLAEPFSFDEINWRVGPVSNKNPDAPKTKPLAYMDARHVQARFDSVVGPMNWKCEFSLLGNTTICTISIYDEDKGEWISKQDGATETDVEGAKGALSDAMKRAAVQWGIGRYLYGLDSPWVLGRVYNGKVQGILEDELPKLERFYNAKLAMKKAKDKPTRDMTGTVEELKRQIDAQDTVTGLSELTETQGYRELLGSLSIEDQKKVKDHGRVRWRAMNGPSMREPGQEG